MQHRLEKSGPPHEHAFFGAQVSTLPPTVFDRLHGMITATAQGLLEAEQAGRTLATTLGVSAPQSQHEQAVLEDSAALALEAPELVSLPTTAREWSTRSAEVLRLVEAGRRLKELHFLHDDTLIPEAWSQDMLEVRQHLAAVGPKWWRLFSGNWRRAKARLRGLCRASFPGANDKRLALVDAIMECQRLEKELQEADALGAGLFAEHWRGARSDWDVLARVASCLTDANARLQSGALTRGTLEALARGVDKLSVERALGNAKGSLASFGKCWQELVTVLGFNTAKRFPDSPDGRQVPYAALGEFLERAETSPADIHSLVAVNQAAEKFVEEGLGNVVPVAERATNAAATLEDAMRHAWYVALIDRAYRERPALAQFEGTSHTRAVDRFRELDTLVLAHARAMVALAHWNAMPKQETTEGQLGILRREFEKKARHMPIRRLMERAGKAIQAIKPVFLMGPMSVATYLPPGALTFDLVVFDEASQVQPVDAIGALLRGRQAVVVGDSKQLPPTSFFDKLMGSGEEGVEEDAEDSSPSGDLESILGLFMAQQAPQRMLRWHYRSRHESLIALSNREFYDNRLMIFPSPDHERSELGLVFHHLPDAVYDAGRSRKNVREAAALADAVMEHARQSPQLSLGVAAFSIPQSEAIRDEVERRRREDPSLEGFFAAHPFEPFFVKNLESVQGDERDVIFISVGYGRDEHGKVSMNFGPLNRDGGERRLNVLITRSKRRCEVFTNLTADMIDLDRTTSVGVRALRQYLHYAQTGEMPRAASVEGDAQSPFEEEVRQALVVRGYRADSQVGSAGFFIDLAVEDPEAPGRYLVGIECDGASYHAARSARDRDRLRQSVLEGLGWRIHRIWSTDWFRDPARELERTIRAIEDARLTRHQPAAIEARKPPAGAGGIQRDDAEEELLPPTTPYEVADVRLAPSLRELLNVAPEKLAVPVLSIVKVESPIHVEEVCRRILDAAGKRSGTRLQATLMAAIDAAVAGGEIQRRGDFLWVTGEVSAPVRDRTNAPASVRRPEALAPEEIGEAIVQAVRLAIGIDEGRVANVAARLLGLTATAGLKSAVEEHTARLVAENRLKRTGSHLELTA
jgi:very-short-patch-repair endonuclease